MDSGELRTKRYHGQTPNPKSDQLSKQLRLANWINSWCNYFDTIIHKDW